MRRPAAQSSTEGERNARYQVAGIDSAADGFGKPHGYQKLPRFGGLNIANDKIRRLLTGKRVMGMGIRTAITMKSKRDRFYEAATKGAFFMEPEVAGLDHYLRRRQWLKQGEFVVSAEIAGRGNMNSVVRVATNQRTFILKQSRPWVEKYPEISAPFDRSQAEAEFYQLVSNTPAAAFMPKFYWVDDESHILCLEDIGTVRDFSNIYADARVTPDELKQLCHFLSLLHSFPSRIANREMRMLNHFHIFVYPFQAENGLDLDGITPGLEQISLKAKENRALVQCVTKLGQIYLSEEKFLLHGDYFPGSWLHGITGVRVIDPEFGFAGPREFDLGVMLAHLLIAGLKDAAKHLACYYSSWKELDHHLVHNFAGVEILRRLLGVAQLPIAHDLGQKRELTEAAISMVLA